MALRRYTKEWLETLCKNSYSYAEVLSKAGRKQAGGSQNTLKQKIEEFEIDISHFTGQAWKHSPNAKTTSTSSEKYSLEEILIKDSPITQKVLRDYIERHSLLEYKCSYCGNPGIWMGKELSLQLHHIDGDNKNNQLSNLTYLCPNCHAMTETYAGRNKK